MFLGVAVLHRFHCNHKFVTHFATFSHVLLNSHIASYSQRLLMYDGLDGMFRNIKLRGRQPNCPVCGDNPSIKHLIDYEQFCGARASDKVGLVKIKRYSAIPL